MNGSHPALRLLTVLGLSLIFCLDTMPDLVRTIGYPDGDIGLRTNGNIATVVSPGLPAANAGMHVGDRIDFSLTTPAQQSAILGGYLPQPGDKATLRFGNGVKMRTATLVAVPEGSKTFFIIIRELFWLIPLLIGIFLVLLRPSPITWGFFLFSLTAGGFPPNSVFYSRILVSWPAQVAATVTLTPLTAAATKIGLILFAFSLARRAFTPWIWAALGAAGALGLIESVPVILDPIDSGNIQWPALTNFCDITAAAIAICGLVYSYAHVAVRLRQRLHWIAAGFFISVFASAIDTVLWPAYAPYWLHTALQATLIFFPVAVAYAILRERVIDINFVVSRTLAYGLLTSAIVGIFALIDLFLSRTMESRFSLPVNIVVALVLGFFFHALRGRIDSGVDRVVFRKRHIAEMRLERAAKAVVHVDDPAAIADYLTRLPVEVLDLTGAALYMRNGKDYVLERCTGWKHQPAATLSTSDSLVAFISSELASVRIADVPMREPHPDRHDAPVLAMPLVFRRELGGFVLFGAHEDGADLDSDDERALLPLVQNAAVTYDHIEAQALRDELRRLKGFPPEMAFSNA